MGAQYYCKNQKRRQAVREHATLNGIDYLEVLDRDAPGNSPRQQTLLVRCFKPLTDLSGDNVRIEGGVRITPVRVQWASPAHTIPGTLITSQEKEFFGLFFKSLPEARHVLVVRTDSPGDYSPYRLLLTTSPTDPAPPTGFDLQLSEVEFFFKAECPSDFDCKQVLRCPPEILREPQIDYLAKDYASFRRLMLDRLAVTVPDWKERNPADVGVMLVEVLAHAADQLSYYQDAVATEAYLGTARKRVSLRRHARLLDYFTHEGNNARVWVCFEVDKDSEADRQILSTGTQLLTLVNASRGGLHPNLLDSALSQGAEVFETLHEVTLHAGHNEIQFYTWGDEECCLPKGSTRATLKNEANQLDLSPGDILIFEEKLTSAGATGDPAHRHVVRLIRVSPKVDPLVDTPVVDIEWHANDALLFPFCLSSLVTNAGGEKLLSGLTVAYGNVVLADHGRTIRDEEPGPETVPDQGPYRPMLKRTDLTHASPYDHTIATFHSATQALVQNPRKILPWMRLRGDEEPWNVRRDLLNSDRLSNDFVVEVESDGTSHLRFGDGVFGRRPTAGSRFKATYRIGNGPKGNVGAEAIAHVLTPMKGVRNVRNPIPAKNATNPESFERIRVSVPEAFRTQERAVTEADYARVAQCHPEVSKAVATRRWTGSWHTMFVTVDRKGGKPVDTAFEAEMRSYLERFRLAGRDVEIEGPRLVPLDIALTVCVRPDYFRDAVKAALLETFSNTDLPDCRRGFFHPDNFTFGQPVYLSQVVAAALQVPGVAWVDADETPPKRNRFRRWAECSKGESAAGGIKMGRFEIARLDNDPNAPEHGRIEFYMGGGM